MLTCATEELRFTKGIAMLVTLVGLALGRVVLDDVDEPVGNVRDDADHRAHAPAASRAR